MVCAAFPRSRPLVLPDFPVLLRGGGAKGFRRRGRGYRGWPHVPDPVSLNRPEGRTGVQGDEFAGSGIASDPNRNAVLSVVR